MLRSFFNRITTLSLNHRWITIAIVFVLLLLGVYAASKMNQELLPSLEFPQAFVITVRAGASSEDLRDLVTVPLEKEFVNINGVIPDGLESTTTSPISVVTVRYDYGINSDTLHNKMQQAIDKVTKEGVPIGLKTTADLTPEIMTQVLTRAPSMWKHFEANQIVAMSPDVLQAVFKVNPDFATNLDPTTRDQLAAIRLDRVVNNLANPIKPVALPSAWIIKTTEQLQAEAKNATTNKSSNTGNTADCSTAAPTGNGTTTNVVNQAIPQIITFNLSALPVTTASVFSTGNVTPEQLRDLVTQQIINPLSDKSQYPDVADISFSGGQIIPQDLLDAAKVAVQKSNNGSSASSATQATPDVTTTPSDTTGNAAVFKVVVVPSKDVLQTDGTLPLPGSWLNPLNRIALGLLGLNSPFATVQDLLNVTDGAGTKLTAAQVLNRAGDQYGYLVHDLTADHLNYLKQQEPDLAKNLVPKTLDELTAESYAALTGEKVAPALTGAAWAQLIRQPGFNQFALASVRDLHKIKGSAAATLNAIVENTPPELSGFAVHLINDLSPDAISYLNNKEPGFLGNLKPTVLSYMSSATLQLLPDSFWVDLKSKDSALYNQLQAIVADPSKAAVAQLKEIVPTTVIADDPNAPALPASWAVLGQFGIKRTEDMLRNPFGQKSAADFLNLLGGGQGASLLKDLTPEVILYLAQKEPTFYTTLQPTTLALFSKETLAKLPSDVQDRAKNGVSFTPCTTVTRTDGKDSLILSVRKTSDANTVKVSDQADAIFAKATGLNVAPIFEQADFIKESISGVAREGGLGAFMAVVVILLFLNFSFRSTLVTAVSIPTSVAIAFVLMYWLPGNVHQLLLRTVPPGSDPSGVVTFLLNLFPASITLNIMTLSGLTVAIGRVVDDSIVVLENIYRQVQTGTDSREAILRGTRDVSLAIFAATLTTVVVFLPIGLTGGIIGEFFLPFGLGVTYALVASFIVAITIVPLLAYIFIKKGNIPEEKEGRLETSYHRLIIWALDHRWAVMGIALLTLVFGMALFATRPTTFLPDFGEPQITVSVNMPGGTQIAQTDVRTLQFEDYVKTLPHVTKYQTTIGSGNDLASFLGGSSSVNGAAAQITVASDAKGQELNNLTEQIRTKAEAIFGSKNYVKVSISSLSGGFGGFAVVVSGPESDLAKINDDVKKTLSSIPGLTNVSSSFDLPTGASAVTYLRVGQKAAITFSGELETQDTLGVTRTAIDAVIDAGVKK